MKDLVAWADESVDHAFDRLRGNRAADRVFYTASSLGEFGLVWIMLALLRGLRGSRVDERAAARTVAGVLLDSLLVNVVLKTVVGRQRPLASVVHPHPFRQPLTSSFPSGHATSAFVATVLLSEEDPLAPVYLAAATLVATSRVYTKIHHASDVAGGIVIGTCLGLLGRRLAPLRPRRAH
jgi:undecaprenyl-diphosphatase